MKKFAFILLIVIAFSGNLFARSAIEGEKVLVTYFSLNNGNTYNVAKEIHDMAGGDIFRIETAIAYPKEDSAVLAQSLKEKKQNTRPALLKNVDNIDQYNVIFIGFPVWWGKMPMVLFTFLETNANDLKRKVIIPFCTHGGSYRGFNRSEKDLEVILTHSKIYAGLAVNEKDAYNCRADVEKWLKRLNIIK